MKRAGTGVALIAIAACSRTPATVAESTATKPVPAVSVAKAAPPASTIVFHGMCDASGAVPLSADRFAVADDEDNVLRVYDANRGGAPLWAKDVSPGLNLPTKGSGKPKPNKPSKPKRAPETDIEAATRIGDLALWLTSHGRNSSGKLKPERLRLFATTTPDEATELEVVGSANAHLLDAVLADPRYTRFQLESAAERAPKDEGGLNIEGMTERREGGVWIGFRNPNPEGKALLMPLLNPVDVIRAGAPYQLGDPILLDLGGLGVRSLSSWHGRYLIVAGHFGSEAASRLYQWDGVTASATEIPHSIPDDLNPEGFFTPEDRGEILLLSDDGTRPVDGEECKKLKDPAKKSFRGRWVSL